MGLAERSTARRAGRRLAAVVGGAALVVAGLTACNSPASQSSGSAAAPSSRSAATSTSNGAGSAAPVPAGLKRFYDQKLDWQDCSDFKCTRLTVPVDYAHPDGKTIQLAVLKAPATGQRVGSLVVNPGGPGGSGVEYAAAADYIVSKSVRQAYDIVGFDPRGVDRSDPIKCYDGPQLDTFLGSDPTPDDMAEEKAMMAAGTAFGKACERKNPELLPHVSTEDAARDMDVLRAALGESKLDYLGKSYGTFLGATYAGLFPKNVGRFVLDGVVPPDLTSSELNEGQAVGFERATRAYVQSCVSQGNCPLGTSVDQGMQRLREFLKRLDQRPVPVTDDPRVRELTEGWGSMGIAEAMYDQNQWSTLTSALRAAFNGSGNDLMMLADQYAQRNDNGTYTGNIMQVIYAVNCLDRPDSPHLSHYAQDAKKFSKEAPTWGAMLAWGSVTCAHWPVKSHTPPHKISAKGSGPILVLGTTRDPATPYEWSKRLVNELANGHLLSYNGDGHTAYMRSNQCVDSKVDDYLLHGKLPPKGTMC
ncbi:MAG TPA: alpha/beta hydrolase [Segeticoccus sp.]|uniref:alpha/beta hydrolase n=1 Tax=Segeticoccus sp. TaxID=2706531 RepID=UPI002D7E8877|nr:alpha/beta hydrolase [Segeticoccus sp.]HET8601795.1 alpha/beta hydrolase [Segeticoccus sp.]